MNKRKGLPNSVYARVRGMRTPVMVAIALGAFGVTLAQAQQMSVGPGCTTATYIDKDCSGYGVGRKSSGVYPIGYNSTYTVGDMQDADDEDPTVNTTAQWQAKWGTGNSAIVNFLAERRGFSNSGRIWEVYRAKWERFDGRHERPDTSVPLDLSSPHDASRHAGWRSS